MTRLSRRWPELALGALLAAATLAYWHYAVRNVNPGDDEMYFQAFSRYIASDPSHVFDLGPMWSRGIQRLHMLMMAPAFALYRAPAALQLAHLIQVAGFVMAAIPAWLIARGIGAGALGALAAAVLVVAVPWAGISATFLTESLGYGMFAWAVWAVWWAGIRPGTRRDLVALVVIALAAMTRSGFLLLFAVLPLVSLMQTWRHATGEGPVTLRLRRLLPAWFRSRPLPAVIGSAGFLLALSDAVVPSGTIGSVAGSYGQPFNVDLGDELRKWHTALSRVIAGVGFIPAMIGVPWLLREAFRPSDRPRGAFGIAGVLAIAAVLVATLNSGLEERYYFYLAFPLGVATVAALVRRDIGPVAVVLGTLVTLALFATADWKPLDATVNKYAGYPAETFYLDVVRTRVSTSAVVAGLALGGGLIAIAQLKRPRRLLLPGLVVAVLVVVHVAQAQWAVRKYAFGPGLGIGLTLTDKSWVDRSVPAGAHVGLWGATSGDVGAVIGAGKELPAFNMSVDSYLGFAHGTLMEFPVDQRYHRESVDQETGLIQAREPLPRYVVATRTPTRVQPRWQLVSRASYTAIDLFKLDSPPRARWMTTEGSFDPTGQLAPGGRVTWRFFRQPDAKAGQCGGLDLASGAGGSSYEVVVDGRRAAAGAVPAGKTVTATFPLHFRHGPGRASDATLTTGGASPLALASIRMTNCPG